MVFVQLLAAKFLDRLVRTIPGDVTIKVVSGMTVVNPTAHRFIAIFDCYVNIDKSSTSKFYPVHSLKVLISKKKW